MRICFMGTPDFALCSLKELIKNNYNVVSVYTKAPKPVGRGQKVLKTVVHTFAEENNITVFTPKSFKNIQVQEEFIKQNFDICIVASYGLILPEAVLKAPKYGCVNIHASLLPKLRGASPIQQAIIDAPSLNYKTGITIMKMDVGLDTGDILLQDSINIDDKTTFIKLYEDLSTLGANLLIKYLKLMPSENIKAIKQLDSESTLTKIIKKTDGKINFMEEASLIQRKINAFNPFPSTYFSYNNEIIKVKEATAIKDNHQYKCGEIISLSPLKVSCKENILQLNVLQRAGKKALNSEDFIRGFSFKIGETLT